MRLADSVHVFETLLGKAYAAIRLVDGTTREPITLPLELRELAARAVDAGHAPLPLPAMLSKPGLLCFFYPDDVSVHAGLAPAEALAAPSRHPIAELSGVLADPARRYNPTAFTVALAAVTPGFTPAEVQLFRTPFGTPVTRTGAVRGTLRYEADAASPPVPFARVRLSFTVTRRLSDPPRIIVIEAESDTAGDFVVPLDRLPALTGTEADRAGTLSVRAPARDATVAVAGRAPLRPARLGTPGDSGSADHLSLHVRPGTLLRVPELPAKHLVAVPT